VFYDISGTHSYGAIYQLRAHWTILRFWIGGWNCQKYIIQFFRKTQLPVKNLICYSVLFIVWEISTGRCMKTFEFGGVVRSVEWCPNKSLALVAVAVDSDLYVINPDVGDRLIIKKTDSLLAEAPQQGEYRPSERVNASVQWEPVDPEKWDKGIRIIIRHFKTIHQVHQELWFALVASNFTNCLFNLNYRSHGTPKVITFLRLCKMVKIDQFSFISCHLNGLSCL